MEAPASSAGPRIRVAALIERDDAVVVVRHRKDSRTYHLLPGGGVEPGETLAQALEREVVEETGLVVQTGRPLLVSDTIAPDGSRHVVNITFAATTISGDIGAYVPQDDRVEAVELLGRSELLQADLRPPIAEQIVAVLDEPNTYQAAYLGSLYKP